MHRIWRAFRFALRPRFLMEAPVDRAYRVFSNYTRLWVISMILLAAVALVPLMIMAAIDYTLTEHSLRQERSARLDRVTSNTRRSVTYFLDERTSALKFVAQEESYESLSDPEHLSEVLRNLKVGFGSLVDLGLIDAQGRQLAYTGPYALEGKDYGDQEWFREIPQTGLYISEVFMGFRNVPHMVIAVYSQKEGQPPFILRATLDTGRLALLLGQLAADGEGDAFLIDGQGVIQTPSLEYGSVLETVEIPTPAFAEHTTLFAYTAKNGEELQVGYAYIKDSPFILLVVRQMKDLMENWTELRFSLMGFLIASILAIVGVNYIISTYMINKAYEADKQQAKAMQHMEDTNRLASIGRLAAGVAHEINNPLAIINMKAGLIKDLLTFSQDCEPDPRLLEHIESVLVSVDRCGLITKQLLGFARQVDLKVEELSLAKVVADVLSFLEKEASYLNIRVEQAIPDNLPAIISDKSKLQQVLLNIISNAFQAMNQGGRLVITAAAVGRDQVELAVADTGDGITKENLKKIFEPFFTTKAGRGGSGLGLSISYGLVKKLGGTLGVESEVGVGTTFIITLPIVMHQEEQHEDTAG